MKYVLKGLKLLYKNVTGSIAFYPILVSIGFMVLTVVMLNIENLDFCVKLKENISYLLIKDTDTARTMLSTLIGGVFSLTVFSFSMVMVVLSQASSNFSPRLLPGLISNKKNQGILGVYIGTLIYSLIILMNVKNYESVEDSIGLSILLGVFFGVSCTGLFVYFIHSISQEIQIQNIINRIYKVTLNNIKTKIEAQKNTDEIVSEFNMPIDPFEVKSKKTGYYKSFSKELLFNSMKSKDSVTIEIVPNKNKFINEGDTLFLSNTKLSEEESDALLFSLLIESNMHDSIDYKANMIKLMEVAIRAMSPGINDPGTAVDVINKLGLLLKSAFSLNSHSYYKSDNNLIKYHEIDFAEMMRTTFQPLRQYSKEDSVVMHKLIETLKYVYNINVIKAAGKKVIKSELEALADDAKNSIFNKTDLETLPNINM